MVGTQVGNYLVQELLGEGGMGKVYRGLEVVLDRPVAIKVLSPELARNPALVERFRAEAKVQANLIHPNVAILYAFLVQDGNAMMVMEYIDGQNIQDIVKRSGPLHVQQAIPWFKQALAGIGAAHRLGIVHRDIKPANLMLTRAGVVKVLDFGIAKVSGERRLTSAGTKLGTLYYMSPEQIQATAVDNRSDIYALGVTLYEMVTARVPFDSDSDFTIQRDHIQTPPPLPTSFVAGVPRGVEKIILRALEKSPADRFQSVEEFSAALDNPAAWESYVPVFARSAGPPRGYQPVPPPAPQPQPPPFNNFNIPPAQPVNIPAAQPAKSADITAAIKTFFDDKRKRYGAIIVAAILVLYLIFKPGAIKPEQLKGVWTGTANCGQNTIPIAITIVDPTFDRVQAMWADRTGVFPMAGKYDGSQLNLTFVAKPEFGLQGSVSPTAMHGRLTITGCTDFSTTRQATPAQTPQ